MKVYSASDIRNVAIMGHSGSGKTTVSEACLFSTGVTTRVGRVEDGNTVSDYDPEEARRRASVYASLIPVEWKNTKINFIDVPGYFDFVGEAKQALRAADLVLIVVSAKSGIEVGTEKAWEYACELNKPRMFFINAMDDENADFEKVVNQLKDKFGKSIAPIQVPFKENGKFIGFVNTVRKEGRKFVGGKTENCDIPADIADNVEEMFAVLTEAVAETDDSLMEKFFEGEAFTIEEIDKGLKNGLCSGAVTPVLCGSAVSDIGIKNLMNSIVELAPSPDFAAKEVRAKDFKTGAEVMVKCDENAPFSAFVFKTIADPYVGRLTLFRVYSGKLKKDTPLYNVKEGVLEKVGHIYCMRGKEQIEVDELRCGDIGAIAKLSSASTQDTLSVKENQILFEEIEFPGSLYGMCVVPKGKGDEDKISQAFSKILEEDKTIKFNIDPETKETVVYGTGDTQLDVLLNKLRTKYKLDVEYIVPTVPYRETLKAKIKVEGKHKKQSGGHGQFGDVWIEFEPSGDMTVPYVFEEKVFGGAVPRQFFPAVEKGIQECVKSGPLAAYPVVGIKATLVDGKYHPVDSSEMAFKIATSLAFKEAFTKGKAALLQPVCRAEITVPDDYTGDVMGDMNKRGGRILGMNKVGSKQVISAEVPTAEMFKYTLELRSMTQGRGEYTMVFDRYEEAPADVQTKVIEARKKLLEADKEK